MARNAVEGGYKVQRAAGVHPMEKFRCKREPVLAGEPIPAGDYLKWPFPLNNGHDETYMEAKYRKAEAESLTELQAQQGADKTVIERMEQRIEQRRAGREKARLGLKA